MSARVLVPTAIGIATLVGFGAGALMHPGAAGAADTTSTPTKSSDAARHRAKCHGLGHKRRPLHDATAARVKAAASKAMPDATVDKVGHDRRTDGYLALLTKSDGTTRVLVHEDKDFKVTKVDDPAPARPGHGGKGHRGPGDGGSKRTTPTTKAAS